ncbi:MAG: hypothetical protein WC314_17245 [Vulcanimicrobiota bacterium]
MANFKFVYKYLPLLAALLVACGHSGDPTPVVQKPPSPAAQTTLERSLFSSPGSPQPGQGQWLILKERPGYPLVYRDDLLSDQHPVSSQVEQAKVTLASFAQITDMHIVDAASPTRAGMLAAFLDFNENFADAIRPQEPLTCQVMEAMVQQLNALARGPVTGVPFSCVVSTGDNGDSKLISELHNYVAILNGREVHPDPTGRYVGVQDDDPQSGPQVYDRYYHPDPPPAGFEQDRWKREFDYREFPGLLKAASAPFQASGLDFPWFAGHGNHDAVYLGDIDVNTPDFREAMDRYATGNQVIVDPASELEAPFDTPPGRIAYALTAFGSRSAEMLQTLLNSSQTREIPSSPRRRLYYQEDFYQAHQDPGKRGPSGHGLGPANLQSKVMDFAFPLTLPESPTPVLGLMMDTVNPCASEPWTLEEFSENSEEVLERLSLSSDGSIGADQWRRIEQRLQAAHSVYYDEAGQAVKTGNPDSLVILFSHHNSWTMHNTYSDPSVPGADGPRLDGATFVQRIVERYPNVVAWVNGHTHANTIVAHRGPHGGFWEVNAASHLDFPQQSRTLELVSNGDGTLSLFGVVLDHAGPAEPEATETPFSLLDLASISRLLAFNNPYVPGLPRMGEPKDRNVELLIPDPRF